MSIFKWSILISGIFLGFSNLASSQNKSDTVRIVETKDGNNYVGTVKYLQDSLVEITTNLGVLTIPKRMIRSITLPKNE